MTLSATSQVTADLIATPDNLFGFDDTRKAANEGRAFDKGLEPCTHCGRGVAEGKGWQVVVVDGGAYIARPDSAPANDYEDAGYLGAWTLGSSCVKGIPMAFRTKI